MNGYSSGGNPYGYETGRPSLPREKNPSGRMMVEGYRKDILNNFETDAPRYNPMNPERPQSSALVDLSDPIQVHLLTETALSDSRRYEILSQEEVDDLKKQIQSLTQRINQSRTNLTIQSKYRDAAVSMTKLYSPGKVEGKRRSLLGNRNSGGDSAREAEAERQASERRCEELAAELWNLEKRLMEPQRRLLEHTAGILQLTHRPSKKAAQQQAPQPLNGMPGSPESLYRYSNSRSSMEPPPDDNYFDDQSAYQNFGDRMATSRNAPKNPIEIPLKSPHREQTAQLRDAADRLKEENGQLRAQSDALNLELESMRRESSEYIQSISNMERRFETLNSSLRDVIIQSNPAKNSNYETPPYVQGEGLDRGPEAVSTFGRHLDYLENALRAIREGQQAQLSDARKGSEAAQSVAQAETQMESINQQIGDLLAAIDPGHPPPPRASGSGLDDQIDYLQRSLRVIETGLTRTKTKDDEQVEAVLSGLWDIIQTGFAEIQQKKADRRKARSEQGLEPEEDDMSGDELLDATEAYSLPAFSKRVQYLYSQATSLKDQKSVLKRQIKQQRELNSKSDSQRDAELQKKQEEIEELRALFQRSEEEAAQAQGMLVQALRDVEEANNMTARNESSNARAEETIKERDDKIAELEASSREIQSKLANMGSTVQEMDSKLGKAEEYVTSLTTKLAAAEKATEEKQKEVDDKSKTIKEKEDEIEQFNMTIVELKTELTIAQAELDGAYGSRKERAIAAAAVKSSAEVVSLQAEVEKLKEELASTLKELENITKETIEAEREKLEAEGRLDDAIANQSSLENELTSLRDQLESEMQISRDKIMKLQEELDNERLKVVPGPGQSGTSKPGAGASMLSEQFRATMREERKKFQEDLREEQARRRKLEEELQRLKKAQGPGKSPLSPR